MGSKRKQNEIIKVGLWIDNLMDRVRVGDNLKQQRFDCQNISDVKQCFSFLQSNTNGLVIIDLLNSSFDFNNIQKQFEGAQEFLKRVICYFPHVQIQLKKNAESCGIEYVYPRSMFFADNETLIRGIIVEGK
jgi:hypothetical protein